MVRAGAAALGAAAVVSACGEDAAVLVSGTFAWAGVAGFGTRGFAAAGFGAGFLDGACRTVLVAVSGRADAESGCSLARAVSGAAAADAVSAGAIWLLSAAGAAPEDRSRPHATTNDKNRTETIQARIVLIPSLNRAASSRARWRKIVSAAGILGDANHYELMTLPGRRIIIPA